MTESTYRPRTILMCLRNLSIFLGKSQNDISKLKPKVQKSIILGLRFVENFYVERGDLPSLTALYIQEDNPTATYFHAIGFLKGEIAIQSVEDEFSAWEYGEIDTQTYALYPLALVKLKYPKSYERWFKTMIIPSHNYLGVCDRDDDPYGLGDIDHYEASLFMRGE